MQLYSSIIMYRYSELRLTNQKLTRQLSEKDEQLQEMQQKVNSVKLELRKSEKAKREVIYHVIHLLLFYDISTTLVFCICTYAC